MSRLVKSQTFFLVLVFFAAGVAFRSFIPMPIEAIWAFFVVSAALGVFWALMPVGRRKYLVYSFFILAFALGLFRHFQKVEVVSRELDSLVGGHRTLVGIVDDEPIRKPASQQMILKIPEYYNQRLRALTRPYPEFQYGDELKISGLLSEPENFSKDFDYKAYLAKADIFYVMRFPSIERISSGKGERFYEVLFALKRVFDDQLGRALPEPESAFIGGLILGERHAIPANITEAFRRTGTSHIVALSGYNITIVASSLMRLLGIFFLPISLTFWLSGVGIVMFTLLTGASASVVRASLMGLLVLLAQKSGRVYHMRNALALAGAVMIFYNPALLRFDASFQLSFLATWGLLYGAPIIDEWFEKTKGRVKILLRNREVIVENRDPLREPKKSFMREVFVSTLAAQIFVLPLLIYNFGQVSLISPLVNLLILPVIPFTMFSGFIAGASGLIFLPLAKVTGWVVWLAAHYELSAIGFFAHFPLAAVELGKWSIMPLILIYVWIFWKTTASSRTKRG